MNSKVKYILGAVTITVIIGGTIYVIKKSRDAEKQEGESISLEEARRIVEEEKEANDDFEETVKITQEIESINVVKPDILVDDEELEIEEYDEEQDEEEQDIYYTVEPLRDFLYVEDGVDAKEDKELRFEPSSDAAKHQFIRMELAEWSPADDVYRIMLQLFEIPFVPRNPGDEMLRTKVIDYKVQFFGFNSKWVKEVSFADIILHYARATEFNCGEAVRDWVDTFCLNIGLEWDSTGEEMDIVINRLNSHSYFNDTRQTFGLFGLTREQMDDAIRIADRNYDKSVTYEVEFNEFLKGCI